MTNIKRTEKLGLKELNVVNDDDSEYEAENVEELRKCPRCGLSALNIKMNHDRKLNDCLSKTCDGAPITLSDTQIIRLIHKHAHFRCMNGECDVKMLETPIKFAEMGSRYTCRLEWLVFNAYLSKSPKEIIASCSNSLPKGETWISEQAIKDIYAHPEKYDLSKMSAAGRRVIENGRESGRATVPQSVQEVIWHEYGHRLEKFMPKDDLEAVYEHMGDYASKISGYACENKSEYIAESFCCFNNGEKDKIDPVLARIFEGMKK